MATVFSFVVLLFFPFCEAVSSTPLAFDISLGSNMVLQREPYLASVYGSATVGAQITVKFGNTVRTTTATPSIPDPSMGAWKVLLPPTPAGGPYTITASSNLGESVSLTNVLFGEVWVCSGQSNMELVVSDTFNSTEECANASNYPDIRLFSVAHNEQDDAPQYALTQGNIRQLWSVASSQALCGPSWDYFSATCWYFGKNLYESIGVPVGLVSSCWGGTVLESWSSPEAISQCTDTRCSSPDPTNPLYCNTSSQYTNWDRMNMHPSCLFNGMLFPLFNMTIRGMAWYQSEQNYVNPGDYELGQGYACLITTALADWRQRWSVVEGTTDPAFPFAYVSLAGWCSADDGANCNNNNVSQPNYPPTHVVADIRWAQSAGRGFAPNDRLVNAFSAMAYDLEDPMGSPPPPFTDIHPRDKSDVGYRLALPVAVGVYGVKQTSAVTGPVLAGCEASSSSITLQFNETLLLTDRLILKTASGLEVQGYDQQWYEVTLDAPSSSSTISASLAGIPQPVIGVRYAYKDNPCCPEAYIVYPSPNYTCEMKSCALYGSLSDLPAVPFSYPILNGTCVTF